MLNSLYVAIYLMAALGLAVFGLQHLILMLLFLVHRRRAPRIPPPPAEWPPVTVQLPVYNERFVIERLIDAACALDYPRGALSIQVLDDSTDETTALARQRVARHRRAGIDVRLLRRGERTGYKGGALAAGLDSAPGELLAVFDADFVPPPDFLRRLVPHLVADPGLGMVQARWGHLNADYNPLTRGQALSLDGQFVVVQAARGRSGLLLKFNGSAGVWRRACIQQAGGWQGDTLTEDLDLSYRAQLRGWRFGYVPQVVVPAEIPAQMAAIKRQQYRWALGSVQVLRKLAGPLWRSPLSLTQRLDGYAHLGAYLAYPLMLVFLLICLPLVLADGVRLPALPWLSAAGLFPPLLFGLSQRAVYPDWKRRLAYLPVLLCLAAGLTLNNSLAVLAAWRRRPAPFARTPKFRLERRADSWSDKAYALPAGRTAWAELALAAYGTVTLLLAWGRRPGLVPALALFALGFTFVGSAGWWQRLISRPA